MRTSKIRLRLETKRCEFVGCTNTFKGSQFQRYCNDERCKEARRILWVKRKRTCEDVHNRVLPKRKFASKFHNGMTIRTQCGARDAEGNRCGNYVTFVYERRREVYPYYCEQHRNAYKRMLYRKGKNAEAKPRRIELTSDN